MRRLATLALTLWPLASAAGADGKLTIAIYAPNAPFPSGDARFSFVSKAAQQIESQTGTPTEPKAFSRAADLEAAIKKGQVDFAILDGVYLAERGATYPVLAIVASGGETTAKWSLFAEGVGSLAELETKRIAYAATGPRDAAFIDHGLLDSELPKHFSGGRMSAPDIMSALSAVSLKRAECVFAPDIAAPKALKRLFDAGRIPNPAAVQLRDGIDAALVEKVKKALLSTVAGGLYDGFRAGTAEPYRALAGRLSPRTRRPVMAEPATVPLDDSGLLAPVTIEPALIDLREQFWPPQGSP